MRACEEALALVELARAGEGRWAGRAADGREVRLLYRPGYLRLLVAPGPPPYKALLAHEAWGLPVDLGELPDDDAVFARLPPWVRLP